jgi:hypothetical protein
VSSCVFVDAAGKGRFVAEMKVMAWLRSGASRQIRSPLFNSASSPATKCVEVGHAELQNFGRYKQITGRVCGLPKCRPSGGRERSKVCLNDLVLIVMRMKISWIKQEQDMSVKTTCGSN